MDSFDSSDDEREPFEQKYNEYGKFVKARLKSADTAKSQALITDSKISIVKSKSWKSISNRDNSSFPELDFGEETELNCQSPQNKSCLKFYGSAESKTVLNHSSVLSENEDEQPKGLDLSSSKIQHQPESFITGKTGKLTSLMCGKPFESKEIKSSCMKMDSFESVIGLKIINPLITVGNLKEKMAGRNLVPFFKVKHHVQFGDLSKDWCLSGAIVSTGTKLSTKGNNYCVWKLSDLKLGLKTVSLFLFGSSYTALWKTPVGTVIGVLNPSVMDSRKDNVDEAMLSVFNCEQIMVFGLSKDFGHCKARKKGGDACKNFINKSHCEFCIYHVEKEYKKFSNSRSNLQSSSGRPHSLRNKVLGKNEVFYAGKSFTAVKPTKTVKGKNIREKDQRLLTSLFGGTKVDLQSDSSTNVNKNSSGTIDFKFTRFQKIKDAQLLERLADSSSTPSIASDYTKVKNQLKNNVPAKGDNVSQFAYSATEFLNKSFGKNAQVNGHKGLVDQRKSNENMNYGDTIQMGVSSNKSVPLKNENGCKGSSKLSNSMLNKSFDSIEKASSSVSGLLAGESKNRIGLSNLSNNKFIDVSLPISRRDREAAKLNALMYIKKKGPIEKINPNDHKNGVNKRKRTSAEFNESTSTTGSNECNLFSESQKNCSVLSERFVELMNKSSNHETLLEDADDKLMEEYFLKMSKKEDMEEKMLNTFKIPCKAVRCLKCKYTWFSASDFCKQDQHPIKVVDAMKRFFKCSDCGNRTATFEIIPLLSCKQCGGCNWKRAPLLSEKRTLANLNQLSIRGGEQKFINSDVTNCSLNLLVPE